MVSSACWFLKFMICSVLLCTFVQISSTQPLLDDDDDDDQAQVDSSVYNSYFVIPNRLTKTYPHGFDIPEGLYNHHRQQKFFYQNKQFNPDNVQLTKRIIMLPRVGRRSIRSTSQQ